MTFRGSRRGAGRLSGLVLVMCAATLWATVGVASSLVPPELSVPDEVYGFVRTVVAGPALLALAFVARGAAGCMTRRGAFREFLAFGVCCAVFQVCLFRSFGLLGVTVTVFLTVCLPPVLAVGWALWRRTEAVSQQILAAIGLASAGLTFFVGDDSGGGTVPALLGLLLSVAASVAFVGMTRTARALAADHSPLLVSGLGLTITAVLLAPVALLAAPLDVAAIRATVTDGRSVGVFLYLGLGATALAYICYCGGMARCRSALPGLVASMIEPAVAAALSVLVLRETLTAWQSVGCLLMLAAMVTLWLNERKAPSTALAGP